MQVYDCKSAALSAAANISADDAAPAKSMVTAAIAYLGGKTDKDTFRKKCAKNQLYARLVIFSELKISDYDADTLCAVHKALFEPRPKCGELRGDELTIAGGSCTDPKLLRGSLKNVLSKLNQTQGAPTLGKSDFAAQLCCYMRELIILSPFAYGNAVTRRAYIQNFCLSRGFLLNFSSVSKKELNSAEREAFAGDDPQPLFTLLTKCLSYKQEEAAKPSKNKKSPRVPTATAQTQKQVQKPGREIAATAIKRVDNPAPAAARPRPAPPATINVPAPVQSAKPAEQYSNAVSVRSKPPYTDNAGQEASADLIRELREIQKTLAFLSARVSEIIRSMENE